MKASPPILRAAPSPDGKTVRVYCEHCRANHTHGASGIVDGTNPHRVAHCTRPGSPYETTGYILQVPGMRRDHAWWEAPPLNMAPDEARREAMALIGRGAPFNACQIAFLWRMATRRRALTAYQQSVMAALGALAGRGIRI
jgi:hypothetical protein